MDFRYCPLCGSAGLGEALPKETNRFFCFTCSVGFLIVPIERYSATGQHEKLATDGTPLHQKPASYFTPKLFTEDSNEPYSR